MGQQTHNDKELAASLTATRERMIAALGPRFGEAFDGDFDTMLEAAAALTAAAELDKLGEALQHAKPIVDGVAEGRRPNRDWAKLAAQRIDSALAFRAGGAA